MTRLSRIVLTLLLVSALAATAALAQPSTVRGIQPLRLAVPDALDLFARLWSFLAEPWSKNGCEVDPDGRCSPLGSGLVVGDNGCGLDPDGRCQAVQALPQADNGCGLDPSGGCKP